MDENLRGLDDQDDSDVQLTLVSLEQEKYIIPKKVAMMSTMIRRLTEGGRSSILTMVGFEIVWFDSWAV